MGTPQAALRRKIYRMKAFEDSIWKEENKEKRMDNRLRRIEQKKKELIKLGIHYTLPPIMHYSQSKQVDTAPIETNKEDISNLITPVEKVKKNENDKSPNNTPKSKKKKQKKAKNTTPTIDKKANESQAISSKSDKTQSVCKKRKNDHN